MPPKLPGLLVVLFLVTGASELHAQRGAIGLKGGINITSVSDAPGSSSQTRFVGGLYWSGEKQMLVVQPEVLYSVRAVKQPDPGGGESTFKENFVQIPLLFGARIGKGEYTLTPYVGPSLAFKTSCQVEGSTGSQDCDQIAGAPDIHGSLWSIDFGVAFDAWLKKTVLTIDLRYDLGLSSIDDVEDSKWRYLAVMAAIGVPVGQ